MTIYTEGPEIKISTIEWVTENASRRDVDVLGGARAKQRRLVWVKDTLRRMTDATGITGGCKARH